MVGLLNAGVSMGIYYLVLFFDAGMYMFGNFAGWIVSVAFAYFLNGRFVFTEKTEHRISKGLLKAYTAYGFSFLLSTLLLFVEVELLGASKTISPIINIILMIPLNFLINKFWTFRRNKIGEQGKNEQ